MSRFAMMALLLAASAAPPPPPPRRDEAAPQRLPPVRPPAAVRPSPADVDALQRAQAKRARKAARRALSTATPRTAR